MMLTKQPVTNSRLEWIKGELDFFESQFKKQQNLFLEKAAINPVEAIKWEAETIFKLQARACEAIRMKEWLTKENPPEPIILEETKKAADRLQKEILEYPFRHCSTSGISNLILAIEVEAKCEWLKTLRNFIRILEKELYGSGI